MTKESLLKALEERATCAHRLASSAEDCISERMWYLQFDTYKNSIDFVHEHWPEEDDLGFKVKKWNNGVPELEPTTPTKPGESEGV